ncbi:carboxylesterase family protein [Gordonia sp. (in: high G+C Gram-positive bacteria)]|uniref:carboxylesterase family protein n=1 Tax=Gordonia sp. (in: high G+C Gram-positive bacteria) TaxID=84139 RepID=UPI003F9E17BF
MMSNPLITLFQRLRSRRGWPQVLVAAVCVVVLVVGVVVLFTIRSGQRTDPAVISTEDGELRGSPDSGTRRFRGIPYAAPPVGDRRWQRPSPPKSWDKISDATTSGRRCIQPDESNQRDPRSSEDCLYLDVTAPRSESGVVPVMVWFHGGAFSSGSGSECWQSNQQALSDRMIKYWTTFADHGVPRYGWPKASSSAPRTMQFRPSGDRAIRADRTHHCSL